MKLLSKSHWQQNSKGILLPIFLILVGTGIISIAGGADLLSRGSLSGFGNKQLMLVLSGVAVLLSGLSLVLPIRQRQIGEWLLVGIGIIVVGMAADLIFDTSWRGFGIKLLVLGPVVFSILIISLIPAAPAGQQHRGEWLKLFTWDKEQTGKFLLLALQLGLLALLIQQFNLENQVFAEKIIFLTFYGFIVHFFLPFQYRLPFFTLLSLAVIIGILGFQNGLWLIGIGLGLISICHLPIHFSARIVLLLVAGVALIVFRAEWFQAPWSSVIWPILGSMFMFRLIIYIYDLRHHQGPVSFWRTLSYFFLFPNVVFPFFPVVDYSSFRRTYYDSDRYRIYQTGVDWIFRGVFHLILYRFVSYYLVLAPEEVTNTRELVQFLISNFALYLRVSGQFHLIIGILHLFGFNLLETHHLYFMASSFTDLWRRINIYWKDFMLKIFYYPIYFRIRHWGPTMSLVVATTIVFLLTWFFHAYQWFWLRGSFLLTGQDMSFWALLGLLVVINTLYETKQGRQRSLGQSSWSVRQIASLTIRTSATFSAMAILWSLWTSDSIRAWFSLWSLPEQTVLETIVGLMLAFVGIVVVFGVAVWVEKRSQAKPSSRLKQAHFFKPALTNGVMILLVILIGTPMVYRQLPGGEAQELVRDLRVDRLNARDAALLQRGYYEDLTSVNRFNSQLWEVYMKKSDDIMVQDPTRLTHDFLKEELEPLMAETYNGGLSFRTNVWGMRDKHYEKLPAPDTYRIAVLGPSYVMGWGVADDETFQWILEERLNRENEGGRYARIEILDFAVPDFTVLQQVMLLEKKVFDFEPDAVFYIANQYDEGTAIQHLVERIQAGVDIPYDYLNETTRKLEIEQDTETIVAEKRLKPFGTEMISWAYRRIVESCRARGILPVWVLMPFPEADIPEENLASLSRLAGEAGFIVLNLSDVYKDEDLPSLFLSEWDHHPNAKAHNLLANRLYEALLEKQEMIPLGLSGRIEASGNP